LVEESSIGKGAPALSKRKNNIVNGSFTGRTDNTALTLFRGGIFFTLVVLLWPILMTASEVTGSVEAQLLQISEAPGLFMANFFLGIVDCAFYSGLDADLCPLHGNP
jgi:hypothetical protein